MRTSFSTIDKCYTATSSFFVKVKVGWPQMRFDTRFWPQQEMIHGACWKNNVWRCWVDETDGWMGGGLCHWRLLRGVKGEEKRGMRPCGASWELEKLDDRMIRFIFDSWAWIGREMNMWDCDGIRMRKVWYKCYSGMWPSYCLSLGLSEAYRCYINISWPQWQALMLNINEHGTQRPLSCVN